MTPTPEYQELIVSEIKQETNNVKLIYFDRVLPYKAGQYLTFSFQEQGQDIRRSYSIASSPEWNEPLCIGVKRISNGLFSRKLHDVVKPGEKLLTLGAGGVFVLPEPDNRPKQLFFFAAGSGIIPIFSLIKTALHSHPAWQLILVYSNSAVQTTIFYKELQSLQAAYPNNLRTEFLFSNAQNLLQARLHPDLIRALVNKYSGPAFREAFYYICGPENYMRLCTYTLRGMYVPAHQIKKEVFHTSLAAPRPDAPDKTARRVRLIRAGREYQITVQYPQSILQAARQAGIILPYSCEVGRCGNCLGKCLSGKVWMSNNEVLTEKEVAQGLILTCTGYAVGGDASIEIL